MTRSEIVKKGWIKRRATFVPPMKGKKMSAESRAKMRAAWARRRALGLAHPRLGIRHTAETRARMSAISRERTPRGANHYAWQGGITPSRRAGRKIPGYKKWRRTIRERAGDACECCQCNRGKGRMIGHHIKSYAKNPALAVDPGNGAWLCDDCHKECHAN